MLEAVFSYQDSLYSSPSFSRGDIIFPEFGVEDSHFVVDSGCSGRTGGGRDSVFAALFEAFFVHHYVAVDDKDDEE